MMEQRGKARLNQLKPHTVIANCRVLGPSHDGNHPWKLTSQSDFPLLTYLGLCAKSCVSHIPASGGSNPSPLFGLSISSLSSMCLVQRSTSQLRGYDHSIIGLGYTRACFKDSLPRFRGTWSQHRSPYGLASCRDGRLESGWSLPLLEQRSSQRGVFGVTPLADVFQGNFVIPTLRQATRLGVSLSGGGEPIAPARQEPQLLFLAWGSLSKLRHRALRLSK
ncbi:hypothetical protein RRG08_033289 [Elysia crispata]|uniref:Uncharacterized protein n=1 Tax=Elysia crispata TaxID=231223 RepID=A0AAE1CKZ5_9GAST|nr:hypothetical protein RRG08_033289 [Elysia crispata]